MRKKTNKRDFICYFILTILVLLWLFPLFMALINSFKTNGELLTILCIGRMEAVSYENSAVFCYIQFVCVFHADSL